MIYNGRAPETDNTYWANDTLWCVSQFEEHGTAKDYKHALCVGRLYNGM